ncbi:MAG: short-chain dehydrogenase/reductase [Microvirga sp.]|nr:short-chain dehydrogenase/reductase [Microvirga sp.]
MDLKLRGRTALVSGGSQGLGLAIARALAGEGCEIILTARDESRLADAARDIRQEHGVAVTIHPADLTQPGASRTLSEAFPDIDILVNNAGAIRRGALEDIDDPTWRDYWELKVFGYINLTRAYYARMKQAGRGVIINVIGAAAERPDPEYIAGATGNAALVALTRALGSVSADHNVRVVGINPGAVLTDKQRQTLQHRAARELGDEARWRELMSAFPFGRTARLEEVGAAAAFLASDLSGYTTGAILTIDGGYSHRRALA